MKTSHWRPSAASTPGTPEIDTYAVMSQPVRVYAHGVASLDSNKSIPLIGGIQIMLELMLIKAAGTLETDSGEILLSVSADGSYRSVNPGILAALQAMDMARSAEYRRGYGDALEWMRRELVLPPAASPPSGESGPPGAQASYDEDAHSEVQREDVQQPTRQPVAPRNNPPQHQVSKGANGRSSQGNGQRRKGDNSDLLGLLK